MDAASFQTLDKFSGIDQVSGATRMPISYIERMPVHPLRTAVNVDIDNTFRITSRPGYADVLTGTDIHSLWADAICLFVDGDTLYALMTDYSILTVRTVTRNARVSFVQLNDRTYYTNGHEIGFVKDYVNADLSDPAKEFKLPLPAGQLIEVYKTRLYVAKDDVIYASDPLCDFYDVRTGYMQLAGKATMLRAVDNGMYVSDDKTWFLKGDGPEDFTREEVYPSRAIPFTDVRMAGQYLDEQGAYAIWTAENVICLGDSNGKVVNLTEGRYVLTGRGRGAGYVREIDNVRHYVNSLY